MPAFGQTLEFNYNGKNGIAELWVPKDQQSLPTKKITKLAIELVYAYNTDQESVVEVGCWFDKGKMIDFDGACQLSKYAIKILNLNGFCVPREFRV